MSDLLTIVIWSVGIIAMAATAWLQDRRDRRQEEGQYARLCKEFEQRLSNIEEKLERVSN
jgi:cytochrome c-type biogenesis protein CcmH/NrfF